MLTFTFSQFSYEFHLHYFSPELNYFNLGHLCSLLITITYFTPFVPELWYMPHVTCSRPEFKWGTNNKHHYRLLAVPIIQHFEHHIVRKAYLTSGARELMLFGIFMFH